MSIGIWPFSGEDAGEEKARERVEKVRAKFSESDERLAEIRANLMQILMLMRRAPEKKRKKLYGDFQEMNKNYNYLIAKDREMKLKVLKDPENLSKVKTFERVTAMSGLGAIPLLLVGAISVGTLATLSIYFITHAPKQKALLEQSRLVRAYAEEGLTKGELTAEQKETLEEQTEVLRKQTDLVMKKNVGIMDRIKIASFPLVPLAIGGAAVYVMTRKKKKGRRSRR